MMKLLPLERLVQRTIAQHGMLSPGAGVLAAVSGGADSMALLCCLQRLVGEWDISLSAAHLNHRLRGEESDKDAEFVRSTCGELGIPFYLEVVEVGQKAARARRNLEEVAREVRYDFLRRTALEIGAQRIALGHTLDDQAETVLMRFLRGSGTDGLSAIYPVVDGLIIRPLLGCSRRNILNYLHVRGVSHREDSSNLDMAYRRNRVRHELIPYLEKHFNPHLPATLAKEAELSREVAGYLESQARLVLDSLRVQDDEGVALPVQSIRELHPAMQKLVVRLALKEVRGDLRDIAAAHIGEILDLCGLSQSGRRAVLPGAVVLRQFKNLVILPELPLPKSMPTYDLPIPGRCVVAEAQLEFVASMDSLVPDAESVRRDRSRAVLDPSTLPPTLTIRSRLPGDRYGGPRHRKVKKMLIDAKVPLLQRDCLPVVLARDTVVWIPGFAPVKHYIARPDSGRCVVIEARPVIAGTSRFRKLIGQSRV